MNNLIYNPELPFIREDWEGNPLDGQGRFVNIEFPFTTSFKDVWKWQRGPKPMLEEKKMDIWRPNVISDTSFLSNPNDCLVWLGHAWFFLRVGGVNMLIDPVFSKIPFVKQRHLLPYPASTFKNIDLVLVSHDHRDHMDKASLQAVSALNPKATVITGLRNGNILRKWMSNRILELGWYQQWERPELGITISYLPTRHWSRRLLQDTNKRLWGAFVLQANGKTIYFGSDSGYGNHFHETGVLFPNIDIAMLGIGAYMPEWFMHQAHMSPSDSVKAFHDMRATHFFPMHHGTLDLSDEPASLPLRQVQEMQTTGDLRGKLLQPDIGAAVYL